MKYPDSTMWLLDVILRAGHLSERAVIDAVMSGKRPAHLERCQTCADRASKVGLWLSDVRAVGDKAADRALSSETLSAQKHRILRRLEHLDRPVRVIAFPNRAVSPSEVRRRVAVGWLGVSAAAGLLLGIVGNLATDRLGTQPPESSASAASSEWPALAAQEASDGRSDAGPGGTIMANSYTDAPQFLEEIERPVLPAFEAMASMTPRVFAATPVTLRASASR